MVSNLKPSVSNRIVNEMGEEFASIRSLAKLLGIGKTTILKRFHSGKSFVHNGHTYTLKDAVDVTDGNESKVVPEYSEEYAQFLETKKVSNVPFTVYDFKPSVLKSGNRYAVALFSDAHIEETVKPESVLGLNEYNTAIAKKRIEKYFVNLANCLNSDDVDDLIFASLGDTISGFIHDELAQTNGLSPLEATEMAQNLIYNGLRYLCENTKLNSIKFIGIVGNHSRTTKKIQHSNGYCMSYEWLMYRNIKKQCELTGLPIEFDLPESEIAIVNTFDKKRFLFVHGFQIHGGNGISGILPQLKRTCYKWHLVYNQDKIYLGHFHTYMNLPEIGVNSSIIGYTPFTMSNAFPYERPSQFYEVFDTKLGDLLSRRIYCD